ncbi:MAG TPA: SMC family ATPase [Acidimicrobiales bacterium]|jgi:exonuclease SbcC|nr:SMC family ATPase [Acidimicrobiales bacterium]
MLLKRLSLRNYRVYEDALDLELPSGLVGIYGSNGSGKSTLLEAILFTLWGKARGAKEDIRTSGVGGDCIAELTFEHEGHLYVVRRSLSGINLTAKAEVQCDGLAMAEGVRDVGRYLHQVLGMDDAAFRASVFAEQKQLAAFSDRSPAQRRELVLQLLGITPLDAARDAARKDAREARQSHDRLRGMLPDLEGLRLRVSDARAAADAAHVAAETEADAASLAKARADAAQQDFARHDGLRQEYEGLVIEGRATRSQLESEQAALTLLEADWAEMDRAAEELGRLLPQTEGLAELQAELDLVTAAVRAEEAVTSVVVPAEPPTPDEVAVEAAQAALEQAQAASAGLQGEVGALEGELARARAQAERSAKLSGEGDCPLCGQALGDAFETVQAHRVAEVREAEARLGALSAANAAAAAELATAKAAYRERHREADHRRQARAAWERAVALRTAAEDALDRARGALVNLDATGSLVGRQSTLRAEVEQRRAAADAAARLQGRLQRRSALAGHLEHARDRVAECEHNVAVLRDKVKLLAFDRSALLAASEAATAATEAAQRAARTATETLVAATRAAADAEGEARRLADAEEQHARLATLADDSRHLGRLAELLNAFRNTVVATVGPRLAVQAAELFAELTDNEYDYLKVDPESYELQICDGGRVFGLDRFSGSEVDLANLALRVAISEHVRFQSGGTVGLLVLDEVFGPLDEDRKARMLQALERLRGRFRQVLVVTHDADIKEQLPSAIEVQKLPGRRARARLLEN